MMCGNSISIHFGQATHSYGGYYLQGVLLVSVDCYKDLGILFDTGLTFHQHASEAAMKASRVFIDLYEKRIHESSYTVMIIQVNGSTNIRIWKRNLGIQINANLRVYNGMQ